ncbi:MAG: hypothetical protein WEF50_13120 [Myxococcota bacterium]
MDRTRPLARLGLALAGLALSACAALPWPSGSTRATGVLGGEALIDLRGAVHVHTRVSHDSHGAIGEIIDAAHGAGVDFVAFTEHTRGATLAPARGEIEGVILIPGWELSVSGGSMLALGVADHAELPREPRALVEAVHARGGAAFVGHFERSELSEPSRYAEASPDGIEIANLHAAAGEVRIRLALGQLFLPAPLALRVLLRTPSANLERWAALPEARAIVGGVDAHAKFRALGPLGGTFDRYRDLFRLLTTHVLVRERSAPAILEALRAGRSYVAFEGLAPVERFEVSREADGVRVRAPREARLVLVCAGAVVSEAEASEAVLKADGDTARCHVEAWLDDDLWIVTSRLD